MKKLLPALLIAFFAVTALVSPVIVSAQQLATGSATSRWVIDPEVTFIGKNAARAGLFLDWTLQNYNWVCVNKVTARQCDDSNNPIAKYWSLIVLYIVVPLLFVVILATSVVIIVTRGKSLTIMKFIPRFIAVILLIVFSYSLLQFFYQFTDLIQGFFLRSDIARPCPPDCISQKDLLYVGWDYRSFIGLRLLGDMYAESAFISLLLTKLTALTYFVMVFLLLVRKIILWFFIIVSPIFPILLLYYPVRNTAKIWIGEFFRWMLYAPLFAIFLNGLVYLWKNQIPLVFVNSNIGNASQIVFPTAVNILLGGPRQFVTPTNSVNLIETFALYVVSLIMLWIVILLPWILLQIFLDYASNFAPGDTAVMKTLVNLATSNRQPPPGGGGVGPQPEGTAISLPFAKKFSIPKDLQPTGEAKQITFQGANVKAEFSQTPNFNNANVNANVNANTNINSAQVTAQVLSTANVKIPSMRDIARYDTALISRDQSKQQEVVRITQQLEKIATPVAVTNTVEREKVTEIREKLVESSDKGNVVASTILNAANSVATRTSQVSTEEIKNVLAQIANPASTSSSTSSVVNREKLAKLHDTLQKESKENNNQLAQSILSVSEKSTASEIEKIREQLASSQTQSNTIASSVLSSISSASKQSQNISQLKTVLQQIANPASVTNSVDKERFSKLHEQLSKESSQNSNQLATSILSVSDKTSTSELEKIQTQLSQAQAQNNSVASSVNKAVQNTQVKKVLQQIANPASVTNSVEREKYSKLHNQLSHESKENNNQLASTILSVNDSTSTATLEKIHDQLMQTKESSVSSSVMSTINSAIQQNQSTTHVKSVLQSVANPNTANVVDREKINKLHETLSKASKEGNQLASSILSVSDKTSVEDIQKLQEKIQEAKTKGEPLANEVSALTQKQSALPAVNRVQTVSKEDYQAVRDMWKTNYANLEIPQGMAGTRAEWIKDDISTIDQTIALLTSADQTKVQEGMDQVSNLLPFLMVGGFSKDEIVSYLKAKQDAAKDVSQTLAVEEEETLSVGTVKAHKEQAMSASMESSSSTTNTSSEESAFGTGDIVTSQNTTNNFVTPQVTNEILAMVNLKMPKMRDIVRYETHAISTDTNKVADIKKMHSMLANIANPTSVAVGPEREKFVKIREKLLDESQKGNVTAQTLLSAANSATKTQAAAPAHVTVKAVLQQIAAPATATTEVNKQRFSDLHEKLERASKEGNEVASSILAIRDTTSVEDIEKLSTKLKEAKDKGEPLATSVLSSVSSPVSLPATNRVQTVNKEEFEEVKALWKENYQKLEVPQGMAGTRAEWIKDDISSIDETIGLLTSTDETKVQEGMDKVANILPFLMVGGFSQDEIVSYLKAKQDAAKEVSKTLSVEEEETTVTSTTKAHTEQTMTASVSGSSSEETAFGTGEIGAAQGNTTNIINPKVSNEILAMVNLKMPKMRDIVRYETHAISKDETKVSDIRKMHSMLANIANPDLASAGTEREKFTQLREKLLDESQKGNTTAEVILSAATSATKTQANVPVHVTVKSVLQQIAAPTTATSEVSKKRFGDLHEKLEKASKEGNQFATDILSVKDTTSVEDIEKLSTKLKEAKEKGEPLAVSVLESVANPVSLPSTNRFETVSKEEFDEVKTLWKENYQTLDLPQGMAGTRAEWIKDDISKMDKTISLLTSDDKEKVSQGLEEVSTILPFLLIGGYSQSEIVSYLQAKQDAAKDTLQTIVNEEDTTIHVENKQQTTTQSMTATSNETPSAQPSAGANLVTQQISNNILALVNLKLPKIQDIARYESSRARKDTTQLEEVEKTHTVLQKLANPASISDDTERERFKTLRDQLLDEKQKGNQTAAVVLSAAVGVQKTTPEAIKESLSQIADPSLVKTEKDKKRFDDLHEHLKKESEKGNELASEILRTKPTASTEEIEKLSGKLKEAKAKGEPVAKSVLDNLGEAAPQPNSLQPVSDDDYEEVKKLWEEYYRTLPVPGEFTNDTSGRIAWINADIKEILETIELLTSLDTEKQQKGMDKVSEILPMLLLGGFSNDEIVGYLKAKVDAATTVVAELQKEEEGKVSVDATEGLEKMPQEIKEEEGLEKIEKEDKDAQ